MDDDIGNIYSYSSGNNADNKRTINKIKLN